MYFRFRHSTNYPVIYKTLHSVNSKIAVQVPPTKGMETDLRKAIGGGHVDFDWNTKIYEIASKHIEVVANYLASRFGKCELQIVTSTTELCTTSCKNANIKKTPVSKCECVCGGHGHGDGWPEGWKLASSAGELLVQGARKTEIFIITAPKPVPVPDPIETYEIGHVFEDGVVVVKGWLGKKCLSYPEDHPYVEYLEEQAS